MPPKLKRVRSLAKMDLHMQVQEKKLQSSRRKSRISLSSTKTVKQNLFRCFPHRFPVITMQCAAVEVQRLFRGHLSRVRHRLPWKGQIFSRMLCSQRGSHLAHQVRPSLADLSARMTASVSNSNKQDSSEPTNLIANYLAHVRGRARGNGDADFFEWIATRIQSWWRMKRAQRRAMLLKRMVYRMAARSIQQYWKNVLLSRRLKAHMKPARSATLTRAECARIIQQCWRSYMNTKIYQYYRDLIRFREKGDAMLLLKAMNPAEYQLFDRAGGLHIRFRLGGFVFPPTIYYKIFTHRHVTDIGAFAPRPYMAQARQRHVKRRLKLNPVEARMRPPLARRPTKDINEWYQRWENNGWRPVSDRSLMEGDQVMESTSLAKAQFHYSKLVRETEVKRRKKRRKLMWLRKMYGLGKASGDAAMQSAKLEPIATINEEDEDDDDDEDEDEDCNELMRKLEVVDSERVGLHELEQLEAEASDLLDWSESLDYDLYLKGWLSLGTTGRIEPEVYAREDQEMAARVMKSFEGEVEEEDEYDNIGGQYSLSKSPRPLSALSGSPGAINYSEMN